MAAERALRSAAPHHLLDALREVLDGDAWSAREVELYLADYSLTALRPVSTRPDPPEPLPMHGGPTGRAFGAQEPYLEKRGDGRVRAHLPV
ncbi:phosphatase, partial [Streptomyces scabiei]